jgi:putative transcriptional regulator
MAPHARPIILAMTDSEPRHLSGRLLIAMPGMGDKRFERTVIYMCSHSDEGAMGLVVNRPAVGVTFEELMSQLQIDIGPATQASDVHFGGPVEMGRGFVLHSADFFVEDATLRVDEDVSLTATLDVLRAMAEGRGPRRAMIALGYSGWAPNQLEKELQRNGWLTCDADEEILFSPDDAAKWEKALAKLGATPWLLSATGGTA